LRRVVFDPPEELEGFFFLEGFFVDGLLELAELEALFFLEGLVDLVDELEELEAFFFGAVPPLVLTVPARPPGNRVC
jgi:uncharacterized protein (DUF3820 family)